MATKITTRSCRGRRSLFVGVWLMMSLAVTSCSIPTLLARNANGIGQASQAMRDTTRSVYSTNQNLLALEPTLTRVAALGPELEQLSGLRGQLAEIALLREDLIEISRMRDQLDRVVQLDARLAQLTALAPALEQLSSMRDPIEQLTAVAARTQELQPPLAAVAGIEPSLRDLEHSVRQLNALRAPLDRTSSSLSRLLLLVDSSPWLLSVGLLVWLAGTSGAVAFGVFLGLRAFNSGPKRAQEAKL